MRLPANLLFALLSASYALASPPAQAETEPHRWEAVENGSGSTPVERQTLPSYRFTSDASPDPSASGLAGLGAATPKALATADFDEDGVPDLITGFGSGGSGVVTLRRGNVDALYPNTPGARERKARGGDLSSPFLEGDRSRQLPIEPELLAGGDFDADGHADIVAGARGETSLYWLRGDGAGDFSAPQRVTLAGPLTALAVGEVNRRDGLADIVAATGGSSPQLAVFEGPAGALNTAPEVIPLPGEALDVTLGGFGADSHRDMALLLARQVVIVKGRDRRLTLDAERRAGVPGAKVTRHPLGFEAEALGAGDFAGTGADTLAILGADGALHTLNPRRPGATARVAAASKTADSGTSPLFGPRPRRRLIRVHASARTGDDLLIVAGAGRRLGLATAAILGGSGEETGTLRSLSLPADAADLLPLNLNEDSFSDFAILTADAGGALQYALTTGTTFVINSTACDPDYNGPDDVHGNPPPPDGICRTESGVCTLNAALSECRSGSPSCTFRFQVPGAGIPHVCWHHMMGTAAGVYDGTTQTGGFARIDNISGDFLFPDNVTLRGLYLSGGTMGANAVVEGCRIGVLDDLSVAAGGVLSVGANSRIGGTTTAARNIISGLWITGDNVTVQGNHFGFDVAGTTAYSTGAQSLQVRTGNWGEVGPRNVTIGGLVTGSRNLFAGHVDIDPGTSGLLFQGNYLGADATGKVAVYPSNSGGLKIAGSNHTIGGTSTSARNLIVALGSSTPGTAITLGLGVRDMPNYGTSNILIQGNHIGTDDTGSAKLGSWGYGVRINGLADTISVGGTAPGAGNVISGMAYAGISIEEVDLGTGAKATPHDNLIQGNHIGTDKSGTTAIPNVRGIAIKHSWDNLIGGTEAGARNLISGNSGHGIAFLTGYDGTTTSTRNTIQGNYVGVDATGMVKLANSSWGIYLDGADNLVGGLTAAARNLVAGNGGIGIQVNGSNQTVQGNYVGVGADGVTPMGNNIGIKVNGNNSTVGGTTASARNVIAANSGGGMEIPGGGNRVQGNYLGVAANGTTPLGNRFGVRITGSNNKVGGLESGVPNLIANSAEQGVIVWMGSNNAILRNSIFNNSMGIDLGNNGVTPNDYQDADTGPNGLQNAPELTSIETASGYTVYGKLHSAPSRAYRLEFYANCSLDGGDQGEGQSFLGAKDVVTGSMGDVLFSTTFPTPSCPIITATATDPDGNTSEFSQWLHSSVQLTTSVSPAGGGTVTPDCSAGCSFAIGTSVTLTPTPALNRTFGAWSGDVTSLNTPLTVTMNGSKSIVANFDATPVTGAMRIAGTPPAYYGSLQQAYAAADSNDVIQMRAISHTGAPTFDIFGLSVTLKGGYNATYSDNSGQSVVGSPFTVGGGAITVENITVN